MLNRSGARVILLALIVVCLPAEGTAAMDSRYAEVNGVRLHYVTRGEGRLILFLHGFPEFWYAWRRQLEEFGKDRQAVAVDLRGYNLSSKPARVEEYAMPLLAADVKALAEKLGAGPRNRFVLVGHDWGGVVAWVFAALHPEYLEKLVIINAPHPAIFARELRENPEQQKASQYMLLFRGEGAEATLSANNFGMLQAAVFRGATKPDAFTADDREAYLEAWSQPGALTGGLNYYRAARVGPPPAATPAPETAAAGDPPASAPSSEAPLLPASLGPIEVPTLVIWGEKDRALLTGNLDGLEKLAPNLRVKRIPDGTHWVVHEYPDLVNGYIRAFLDDR